MKTIGSNLNFMRKNADQRPSSAFAKATARRALSPLSQRSISYKRERG